MLSPPLKATTGGSPFYLNTDDAALLSGPFPRPTAPTYAPCALYMYTCPLYVITYIVSPFISPLPRRAPPTRLFTVLLIENPFQVNC